MTCRSLGRSPCTDQQGSVGSCRADVHLPISDNRGSTRLRIWRLRASEFDSRLPHKPRYDSGLEGSAARDYSPRKTGHVVESVVVPPEKRSLAASRRLSRRGAE